MLNDEELLSFATATLNTFSVAYLDTCKALAYLKEDIRSTFDELNLQKVKRQRCSYFNIDGVCDNDYSERVLQLDVDKKIIYGIRHLGANRDFPFICVQPNFSIFSKEELMEVYQKIKHEFEMFRPLYMNFWSNCPGDCDFLGCVYMVALSREVKELSVWREEGQIDFESICDDSYYDWYKKGYDVFHRDFPQLKNKVTVNSIESMKTALEQNLLKYILYGGERVGLIAAEKASLLDHDGIYFIEIFIEKKMNGRGLAKAAQKKFVTLFTEECQLIWGTIDAQNVRSYKTAFANGRKPIRYECFIHLDLQSK